MSKDRIPELSEIPFTGAKSITAYSQAGRKLCRDLTIEFDMAADEVYAALVASQKGNPMLLGVDVRIRARRVQKRLKRASEHTKAAGAEMVRFHAQFRKEFADVLNPPKSKPKFNFKDD
ncbi:hypothetical protein [Actinomadura rupiterrae]|uniref:hypothetical protein n=1 Tax=Actinomadura rupiterrae TaxID=559627 RepID=UPI0020A33E83|nr:hypothetical protein [Actinomadura rupiterrae]MCP2336125.1 hypothetical protein [Actinomadura rupiterrae]